MPSSEIIRANRVDFWQEVVCRTLLVGDCAHVQDAAFHGEVSTVHGTDISLTTVRSAGQRFTRTPRHLRDSRGDSFLLTLQTAGSGLVAQHGREVPLDPGDLTCVDSAAPVAVTFPDEFEQLVIHVPREIVASTLGPPERLTTQACLARRPMVSLVTSFLRQTAATLDKVAPETTERLCHISVSLIMTLLSELNTRQLDQPTWSRTALRYRAEVFIRAHARNHALSTADVAAHLRISIRYLQDLFRDDQTTPSECIWTVRLQESRRDLADPSLASLSIGTIALRCGFLDFAHFSHRFRAAYGISAREFRLQERARRFA